jgi:hypothetical protein
MQVLNEIYVHVLLSTLFYMFRRILRYLQGLLYRKPELLLHCKSSFENTLKLSLKLAQ